MSEYKSTLMLRFGVLLFLSPVYVLGGLGLYHDKQLDILNLLFLMVPLLIVAIVWIYYGSLRVGLGEQVISKKTIFGSTEIKLDKGLKVFLDVRTPMGDLGNALFKGTPKYVVSKIGSESKLHINIVIENNAKRISLDSNIKGISEIRDKLSEFLLENIYPHLFEKYKNHTKVIFGPISIKNGALDVGKKQINIGDIGKIETRKGKLIIGSKGKLFALAKIPTLRIPNLVCFISLINQISNA